MKIVGASVWWVLVFIWPLLNGCHEAEPSEARWYVGTVSVESPDLNTTQQSRAYANKHALRWHADSLEWITFASPAQSLSYTREVFPVRRRDDTLWLPPDFGEGISFLTFSDSSAMVVDSQDNRRVAELLFLPVRPQIDTLSLGELQSGLLREAHLVVSPYEEQSLVLLDDYRAAVAERFSGYRGIIPYYLVRLAGGTFLVLDHGFAISKVQIVDMDTDSVRGYLYGAFGGPVVLRPLRDPVVNGDLLLGGWEIDEIHLSGSDDSNSPGRHPGIHSITVSDSTFAYRVTDRWFTYPFQLIESTGMIVLPDERLWLVTALSDSLLEVIPDVSPNNRFLTGHRTSFRRQPVAGPTGTETLRCSTDFLAYIVNQLPDIADGDVATLLHTPPSVCPAYVIYAEWYNEVLFSVLAAHPDSFRAVFQSLPVESREAILAELREPVHDAIDMVAVLKAYHRIPAVVNDPIEEALLAATKNG